MSKIERIASEHPFLNELPYALDTCRDLIFTRADEDDMLFTPRHKLTHLPDGRIKEEADRVFLYDELGQYLGEVQPRYFEIGSGCKVRRFGESILDAINRLGVVEIVYYAVRVTRLKGRREWSGTIYKPDQELRPIEYLERSLEKLLKISTLEIL